VKCYLYGAWIEEKLKANNPKEILAKRGWLYLYIYY